ncbi:MAG TPA: pilus assembly protein TadG-related protein, partial [Bradyrhizobium sp.]|nr:pilus assembly protein TadG-related protein [Bradyrhizobium sp.]
MEYIVERFEMRHSVTLSAVAKHARRLRKDEGGAVSVLMGLLIVPLVGFLALGVEVSNWYMITRGMQNAADTAALAAATNGGANYDVEAKAVAAQYGYVDGVNTISIAVSNTAPCPSGGNNCYSVTISGFVPLYLSQVVGFKGNPNNDGKLEKQLSSVAVAKGGLQDTNLCML